MNRVPPVTLFCMVEIGNKYFPSILPPTPSCFPGVSKKSSYRRPENSGLSTFLWHLRQIDWHPALLDVGLLGHKLLPYTAEESKNQLAVSCRKEEEGSKKQNKTKKGWKGIKGLQEKGI